MIDFTNTLEQWFNNKIDNIHTCIPGIIEEYDGHKTRKAKVKPMVKLRLTQNKIVEIPSIENVPVIFPSSASFNMLYPLVKGDGVLLLFSEAAIGSFLNSDEEVDADDMSKFSLADCIAIAGLWSYKTCPDVADSDDDFLLQFQDFTLTVVDSDNYYKLEDKDGNIIESNSDGIAITDSNDNVVTMDNTGIVIEDKNGNTVEMGTTSIKLNGNLEVLQ